MLTFHLGPVQIMQGRVGHVSDVHPCLFWVEAWINCRSPINQSQEWRVELSKLWMLQMMLAQCPCLDTRLLIPQKTSAPLVPALVSPSLHLSRCLGLATQIQKTQYFFSNSSFIDKMVTIIYSTGDLGLITNGKYTLRIRFLASFGRENAAIVFFVVMMITVIFLSNIYSVAAIE